MTEQAKQTIQKGVLWNTNFIMSGYVCLLLWNTVLNLSEYFSNTITQKGFTQMSFAYCLSSVLAFCTSNHIMTSISRKKALNIMILLAFAGFFLCVFGCRLFADQTVSHYFSVGLAFLSGYFISFAQAKISSIAGEAGNHEIVYYNFGTGLAGVGTNVFSWCFTRIFPTGDPATENEMLLKQAYANGVVVIVSVLGFFVIQHLFGKAFGEKPIREQISDIESVLTEESPKPTQLAATPETDTFIMLKTIIDLLLGIFLLYTCTLVVVAFFNIFCFFKFDKNINYFTIPTYSFFFNAFDTIGKFIPPAYLIQNNGLLQSLNGSRFMIAGYFYYILFCNVSKTISSPYLRSFANAILGVTNGYFTSSFFTLGASRFSNPADKGKATYFSVLFLCIGVVSGTFVNLFLESMLPVNN